MITEEAVVRDEKLERLWAVSYHKGVIDFAKWTSTLAAGAMLWVSNAIGSIAGCPQVIMIISSVFLIISLVLTILVVNRVLAAWAAEWVLAREMYTFHLIKMLKAWKPMKVTEEQEAEQIDRLLETIDRTKPFREPAGFRVWVIWHIVFLTAGLFIYLVAQVLGSLV